MYDKTIKLRSGCVLRNFVFTVFLGDKRGLFETKRINRHTNIGNAAKTRNFLSSITS